MSDPVFKKVEIVGTSTASFSDATNNAVVKASESIRNLSWFEVVEQRATGRTEIQAVHDHPDGGVE